MNTTEVQIKNLIKSFPDLYKYAEKQFLMYEKIEGIDNWKEYSFSIDCSTDQMKFKDMLQIRFVEELSEATHALDNKEHFLEEITDALNFFLSAYVMLGVDFKEFSDPGKFLTNGRDLLLDYKKLGVLLYWVIDKVGYLCNLLKNRPWAQSNYLVSLYDFDIRLKDLWDTFWCVLGQIGLSDEKLFELFERKYLVNLWRIKTGY